MDERPRYFVGRRLARLRAERGLSLEGAARRVGVRRSTWRDWEANGLDSLERIFAVAQKFSVSPDQLIPKLTSTPTATPSKH